MTAALKLHVSCTCGATGIGPGIRHRHGCSADPTRADPPTDQDERYTPTRIFRPLHQEHGFTLDACATPESTKLPRYFTKAEDGLAKSWEGERVWVNPPYSDVRPWLVKAWEGKAELVVMLLRASTDSPWWHELVEPWRDSPKARRFNRQLTTRFLPGRISFGSPGDPEGERSGRPRFYSVLLTWRPRT